MDPALEINVLVETGNKRVFAVAVDWPGLARSGRDEAIAIQHLTSYAQRYQSALRLKQVDFPLSFIVNITERKPGTSTTDYGAPDAQSDQDNNPLVGKEFERQFAILEACWMSLLIAVQSGVGKELHKGPRGGGRDLEKIFLHVVEAHAAYLQHIGFKTTVDDKLPPDQIVEKNIDLTHQALLAVTSGKLPPTGPRGGVRWKARYFIRRSAWHILDHAWEIEDRML